MRGGLNMTRGAISRRSRRVVLTSSGKLSGKPMESPQAIATICSPIQASGSTLTKSSLASSGSTSMSVRPMPIRLAWVSMASLGLPVVPEVVDMIAIWSGRVCATSSSNRVGSAAATSAPVAHTASNDMSHGSS